jgi:hypothetical protein
VCTQVGPAEVFEIHREEGGIVENVEPAQAVVEFVAVEHPGVVGQAEHILRDQVAVSIDDEPASARSASSTALPST